jgi:membrane protease YdiL (CAAX protease family)
MQESRSHPPFKVQLIELGIFVLLIIPSMVLSFFSFQRGAGPPFVPFAIASMLQQAALLGLVLYFGWRNKEPFRAFGWTREELGKEILLGVVLYFPIAYGLSLLQTALKGLGLPTPESVPGYLSPSGTEEYVLIILLFTVVAVSEEGVFRGYLIRRLVNLSGHPAVAVLGAAGLFCIGHGYQNLGGVIATFALGAVFGAVYLWRNSLAAPIVIHFIQNAMAVYLSVIGLP